MAIYMGLDCGGSSCRAVSVSESGQILHQGQAGPANLANTPPGKLLNHLIRAAKDSPSPQFVCGCFAGLLTEDDRSRAIDILGGAFPKAEIRAEPDFFAALKAAGDVDICVVAGTGSIVCSQIDGKLVKSGGRGFILGDPGSAFQYGRAAMLNFIEVGEQNISESLRLTILEKFGSIEEPEVLARLYRGGLPAALLAKLSHPFAKDARAELPYALEALNAQTSALVEVVVNHATKHFSGTRELRICLAGGLWESGAVFRTAFESMLIERGKSWRFSIQRIQKPPVFGAVELAKELRN